MAGHHHHSHCHHASHPYEGRLVFGILLNAGFVIIELTYGFLASSLALLADAGHNASDVLGLLLAWGAIMLARRKPSGRYTYGLQSASIMAAMANALLLLIAVGGIAWEAVQRFSDPKPADATTVIIVAGIGTLINGLTAYLLHGDHHRDLNMRGAYLHMLADAAISLGVVLSGVVIMATGWLWVDPLVSLVIALAIVASAWQLLRDSTSLALHAAPRNVDIAAVRSYLQRQPGVAEVHDLHIWAISTTDTALSAHLLMPSGHPGDEFLHQVTQALARQFHIGHATLQIEINSSAAACHLASHAT